MSKVAGELQLRVDSAIKSLQTFSSDLDKIENLEKEHKKSQVKLKTLQEKVVKLTRYNESLKRGNSEAHQAAEKKTQHAKSIIEAANEREAELDIVHENLDKRENELKLKLEQLKNIQEREEKLGERESTVSKMMDKTEQEKKVVEKQKKANREKQKMNEEKEKRIRTKERRLQATLDELSV